MVAICSAAMAKAAAATAAQLRRLRSPLDKADCASDKRKFKDKTLCGASLDLCGLKEASESAASDCERISSQASSSLSSSQFPSTKTAPKTTKLANTSDSAAIEPLLLLRQAHKKQSAAGKRAPEEATRRNLISKSNRIKLFQSSGLATSGFELDHSVSDDEERRLERLEPETRGDLSDGIGARTKRLNRRVKGDNCDNDEDEFGECKLERQLSRMRRLNTEILINSIGPFRTRQSDESVCSHNGNTNLLGHFRETNCHLTGRVLSHASELKGSENFKCRAKSLLRDVRLARSSLQHTLRSMRLVSCA